MKFRNIVLSVSILFSLHILPANLNGMGIDPDLIAALHAKAEFDFVKKERDRIKAASRDYLLNCNNLDVINQVDVVRYQIGGAHAAKSKLGGDK